MIRGMKPFISTPRGSGAVRQAAPSQVLDYRVAQASDIERMAQCRLADPAAGPADERMADYFAGTHHPQQALAPRIGYVAAMGDRLLGYTAGHLTRRHQCDGELQYLFVAPAHRRAGIAGELVRRLFQWFVMEGAYKICVNVAPANAAARAFYGSMGAAKLTQYWDVWHDIRTLERGAA